ncbi:hypothetical protein PG990_012732 [Apiospora arundinis]
MSWSSSMRSNDGPNMRLRTRDRSKPSVQRWQVGFVNNAIHSASPAPESHSSSDNDDLVVIRPDVTAFSAPSSNVSQLLKCTQHLKTALLEHQSADTPSQAYSKLGDTPRRLCEALLKPPAEPPIVGLLSGIAVNGQSERSERDGRANVVDLARDSGQGNTTLYFPEKHLEAIRGWKTILQGLHDRLHASLLSTYSTYEEEATKPMAEQLFDDPVFRDKAIQKMKQSKVSSSRSCRLDDGLATFETRFCNFESITEDLAYVHSLLHLGESGISLGRSTQEITISQRGDAVLEFANNGSDSHPVLRFRVLSHMLSETSPVFARIFDPSGVGDSGDAFEGIVPGLPRNPVEYTWSDGAQTRLYRMPQLELNAHGSFELLLHAAHLHNESVPREIEFETFVALAKVCMRYQCTSPVEMSVEYRWLPQWMHKAIDDMPDGLLLISYAFGLRRLFTRMSKTAILNVVDENDLKTKPWPQKMKDRIWAVRTAKMGQILACCSSALQEYLQGPGHSGGGKESQSLTINKGMVSPSKPRCPKGNPCCDATNLGWLMIIFAQQQILPHIMQSPAVAHLPVPPTRSLNQIFESLRSIVSPPQGHGGVCEYAPTFRSAVNDISNSVQGLTLFEVSGQHGWALSQHKVNLPQVTLTTKDVLSATAPPTTAEAQVREAATVEVAVRIMEHIDTWRDLCSVAMVSKAFYSAYHANSEYLSRHMDVRSKDPNIMPTWPSTQQERSRMNHKSRVTVGKDDRDDGLKKDQQKVLIYDRDDDNTTTGDYDLTPPPSDTHDEQHQHQQEQHLQRTVKVMREESERLLWTQNDCDRSRSRDSADYQNCHPGGPAASLYPTNLLSSSTNGSGSSGDAIQAHNAQVRRNDQGSEKFLASEVAVHFAVKASSTSAIPAVTPVPEAKSLVTMEDKNLREQRDRKVGILL